MQLTTVTAYRKTASAQCILKQKNTEKKLINEIQKKKSLMELNKRKRKVRIGSLAVIIDNARSCIAFSLWIM